MLTGLRQTTESVRCGSMNKNLLSLHPVLRLRSYDGMLVRRRWTETLFLLKSRSGRRYGAVRSDIDRGPCETTGFIREIPSTRSWQGASVPAELEATIILHFGHPCFPNWYSERRSSLRADSRQNSLRSGSCWKAKSCTSCPCRVRRHSGTRTCFRTRRFGLMREVWRRDFARCRSGNRKM